MESETSNLPVATSFSFICSNPTNTRCLLMTEFSRNESNLPVPRLGSTSRIRRRPPFFSTLANSRRAESRSLKWCAAMVVYALSKKESSNGIFSDPPT